MRENQKIKFYNLSLKQPNNKYDGYLQVIEEKDENNYGNKTYLYITHFDKLGIIKYNTFYIDCRYEKNYSMTKSVKKFAKNYFGKNLQNIQLIKQKNIIK